MKIYLDLLFLLNFGYDLIIFITLDVTLKRHSKLKRIILASIVSALSVFSILIPYKSLILFINVFVAIISVLIMFGFKNIKYTLENLGYLYMISVILAGFLYFLSIYFDNANYVLLLIIAPIILVLYIKEQKNLKEKINYEKIVTIILKNNRELKLRGFIDTGNRLQDPITKKYVILIHKDTLKGIYNIRSPIYVTVRTVSSKSLIECVGIKDLIIDDKHFSNCLLGVVDTLKKGSECILNYYLLEDL